MSEQEVFDALKYRIEVDCHGNRFYYNSAGQLHRESGPAIEYARGTTVWYHYGLCHRCDGPAIEYPNGDKCWFISGDELTEAEFIAATQPAVEMTVADIEKLLGKRVKLLKERLLKLERQRGVQRKARTRRDMLNVSLVGYTNAGKSTLFNALTHAGAYAADQLFATLDTTSRKLWLEGVGNVVISDTVGFIRDLPHSLVAAFHATLDATSQADLLLHVIDSASPSRDEQIAEVNKVLEEIGASEVPQLMVLNKLDLTGLPPAVERNEYDRIVRVRVSAKCGDGLPLLRAALTEVALEKLRNSSDRVSAADQPIRSDQILDSDSFL